MVREALVLDSNDDLAPQLAKMLSDNGYVVRVLATRERAKIFEKEPVYIHTLTENYEKVVKEIDFSHVEVAVFPSPNEMLNLSLARLAKSQGVPMVVIVARSASVAKQAEDEGITAIITYHCVVSRLLRMLNLKFTRIIPIKGGVALLEMLVTSDSKVLGRSVGELEEETGAKIAVVRDDGFISAKDAEIQEGDYLIAVGPQEDLQTLAD
ncbi:MAG: TrkA family potassium uptake protein [Pyrobaculum sp.]|nr:TrkA family potassium uptake protein [Pyrobaculum sp.]MCC6066591.1 TrkA family potassium uptake protein [Pyrobaculum sp.]NAZ33440.1 TrkA family potassium uptake protein [Pyrobaculum sp.]NAZ33830.1 TrkA family potassium uptake protein [Pyrobaculum sp.]